MVYKKKILKENTKLCYNIKEGRDNMKNKKLLIIIGVILVVILGGVIYYFTRDFSKDITLDNYFSLKENESNKYVFVYNDEKTSEEILKMIKNIAQKERVEIVCLNISDITESENEKFLKADEYTESGVIIPMLAKLKDGEIDSYVAGSVKEEEIMFFLNNNQEKENE